MRPTLKQLMVGTAAALLAAGCASTGSTSTSAASSSETVPVPVPTTTSTPAPTSTPAAGSSSPSSAVTGTALGGGAPTTSAPAGPTVPAGQAFVYGCDRQPVAQPKSYILTCGDGGVSLNQLVWSGWGGAQATATGVRIQNSCTPSCAAGSPISSKATVTLSGLSGGHYTKLRVVTAKGTSDYRVDAAGPVVTGAR